MTRLCFAIVLCGIAIWIGQRWMDIVPQRGILYAAEGAMQAAKGSPPAHSLAWDSDKVKVVRAEWEALAAELARTASKQNYEQHARRSEALLRERLSMDDMRGLARSCATIPKEDEDRSRFERVLLRTMIVVFTAAGDRESLVAMLSRRCPPRLWLHSDIEWYLVCFGEKMQDPILILSEAFAQSEVAETRRELAAALRRGFGGSGVQGKDDAEFVKNAVQWYTREKDRLVLNDEYTLNAVLNDRGHFDYEHNPLFKPKPPAGTEPKPGGK
jgi:hypothetical protein